MRGEDAFARLIAPVTPEEFFAEYWGKKHLHISRNDAGYHHDVLTFDDVDAYLARNDLRYPYIRLVKEGRELPLNNYGRDRVFGENVFQGNLDQDALFREYADGATMCMQLQHLAMPTLGAFTRELEGYFGYRTQSTIFLTPGNSQGFTQHFDSHDFFTMGVSGEKTWRIYAERAEYPLPRTEVLDSEVDISDALNSEFRVKAGDTLYVPRGVYHDARSESGTSMQISLGVFPYYWCDVLHTLIDELADKHARLRMAVAPTRHIPAATLEADFREMLALISDRADITGVLNGLQRAAASKRVKDGTHRLRDLEALEALGPDDLLVARDVEAEIRQDADRLLVVFYDKQIAMPGFVRSELDAILAGSPFSASSLPGGLDTRSRMALVRKLLSEGLLTLASPSPVRPD